MSEPSNWSQAGAHTDLAEAIAHAEGFYVPGSIPALAHNPGDLVCAWLPGPKMGAEGIHIFENDATGWAALEHQLALIRAGKSREYQLGTTIGEMAAHWTRTQQTAWALNVCDGLAKRGRMATIDTQLKEIL